ncbi:hypothetical protein [Staphylococcus sp.]|uniref:hypothetical protein n=1 Tax=Staphylococcus sp. TaxID=29387 RepID=UPI000EB932F2|nr:hypothetical protein [Staphylococcus sp.]HBY82670.1 hypothetical protein [Staphylococcus sp.]
MKKYNELYNFNYHHLIDDQRVLIDENRFELEKSLYHLIADYFGKKEILLSDLIYKVAFLPSSEEETLLLISNQHVYSFSYKYGVINFAEVTEYKNSEINNIDVNYYYEKIDYEKGYTDSRPIISNLYIKFKDNRSLMIENNEFNKNEIDDIANNILKLM